jgi:4-amino-4-deoxy-L-arabinose transferase-like glycosyltransferase
MQPLNNKKTFKNAKDIEFLIVLSLCIIGIILRTILFGKIPPGLNQDEAAAGYEAYSLLLTGKDKWGNIWPVYFVAWGAGQNVLYSYLLIPVIHFFGLTTQSVRSINLIFGILTIPLLYEFTKKTVSRKVAYIVTFLLAISPWHVMLSRWGLESNLLPFFTLLGFYTIHRASVQHSSFSSKVLCLVPWAVALYAYGTFYFMLLAIIFLYFKKDWKFILRNGKQWIPSILVFLTIAFPIILFIIKNSIFRSGLFFEKYLPFSIPLLTSTPFRAINPQTNLEFIFNGFQDDKIWNRIPGVPPVYMIFLPFLVVGIIVLREKWKRKGKVNLFLVWLYSCIPIFFISSLNINRANSIFIPSLVVSIIGYDAIIKSIKDIYLKRIFRKIIFTWTLIGSFLFITNYFFFYSPAAANAFNYGLEEAFYQARSKSDSFENIFVTDRIKLPYVYALFFERYSPAEFQKNSKHNLDKDGIYDVKSFGRFYFDKDSFDLRNKESFVALQRVGDESFCKKSTSLYRQNNWKVLRCFNSASDDRK